MATTDPGTLAITLEDIQQAREKIRDSIVGTPCVRSGFFSEETGTNIWLKLDNLQRTSSFKERGALNRMLALSAAERARGVIAASAGNHAQGVAYHAARLGIGAKIVMPTTTPEIKQENTRKLGAEVVIHGRNYDEAMAHALELVESEGRVLIHPFDDPHVIAGQGTLGLELLEQCPEMDTVVVAIGGGGLIAGIAAAVKALRPDVRVVGVESAARDAAARSLAAGERVSLEPAQMALETIADGIAVQRIGALTFPLIQEHVDEIVTVQEAEIADAIFTLLERQKVLVEGASASTLAAVRNPAVRKQVGGKNVVLLLSGGNIDLNLFWRIMERCMTHARRLAYLRVRVPDKPGKLAGLSSLLGEGEHRANILQLTQRHSVGNLWVTEAEVDLTLETRGPDHVEGIKRALEAAGYGVMDESDGRTWHADGPAA